MRIFVISLISIIFISLFLAISPPQAEALVRVKGYPKKNGKFVQPHFRMPPNGLKIDNFSQKGNVNPFNGKKGTKRGW